MGTISNHRYPNAICNAKMGNAAINNPNEAIIKRLFERKLNPDRIQAVTAEKPKNSNLVLFELFELNGFVKSPNQNKDVFLELTPTGPILFLFGELGAEQVDASIIPDNMYIELPKEVSLRYHYDESILNEVMHMLKFEKREWGGNASFMRVDSGINSSRQASYYFPISSTYIYGTYTVFGFPTHRLVGVHYQEAKEASADGKPVYTSDIEFTYGRKMILQRGFLPGAEDYFVAMPFSAGCILPKKYQIRVTLNGEIDVKTK